MLHDMFKRDPFYVLDVPAHLTGDVDGVKAKWKKPTGSELLSIKFAYSIEEDNAEAPGQGGQKVIKELFSDLFVCVFAGDDTIEDLDLDDPELDEQMALWLYTATANMVTELSTGEKKG